MPPPAPELPRTSAAHRPLLALAAMGSLYCAVQGWRNPDAFRIDEQPFACVLLWLATAAPVASAWAWTRARRQPVGMGTLLRLAFVAAVFTWLTYLIVIGGFHRIRVEVTLAAGAGGFALGLAAQTRTPSRLRSGIAVATFQVALFAVLGEAALRTLRWVRPTPLLTSRSSGIEERLRAHAFAPGELHLGFRCNALGYYDGEFDSRAQRQRPAVAVIGDSFSGSVVPHGMHYTTVCEQQLNDVDLWNVGWPSIGPDEYLHLLRRDVRPLDPDAIVVALFLGNDYAEVRPYDAVDRALGSVFDRGNTLLLELPRRLSVVAHAAERGDHAWLDTIPESSSATMRTLQPWLDDYRREPATMSEPTYFGIARRTASIYGVHAPKRWHALIRRIQQLRKAAEEIPFGLLLIPDEGMVEDRLWQRVLTDLEGQPLDRHGLRQRLVAFCAQQGIPCFDAWPALHAVPPEPDGDRHLYLRRDTHWNVRGNRVAGRAMAPFVRALLAGDGR